MLLLSVVPRTGLYTTTVQTAAMHKIPLLIVPLTELPHPANVIHQLVDKKPPPIRMHNALLVHELHLFPFFLFLCSSPIHTKQKKTLVIMD